MTRPLFVILAVIAIDMIGIGLVMPVLPGLLRHLGHTGHISVLYGALMAAYAAMQFLVSPFLGALSDRHGRRPVLLFSLAGATIDYLVTAAAPTLLILVAGRILAGATGANVAVATSAIADITPPDGRAKRFGQMSAVLGIGLIAGPMIGGLLGGISLRAPYLAAAALNAANAALVLFALPETRGGRPARLHVSLRAVLPSFAVFRAQAGTLRLVGLYVVLVAVAQVPMSLWILYCQNRYGWTEAVVGLSLAVYGLLHAGAQWFLIAPLTRRFGERGSVVLGVLSDGTAYMILGLAAQGWVAFALMPLFCLGGVAMPALQSLLSRDVPAEEQGRLQGALVSLGSLIGIPGPVLVTLAYAHSPAALPGLVWVTAATAYLLTAFYLLARPIRPLTANLELHP